MSDSALGWVALSVRRGSRSARPWLDPSSHPRMFAVLVAVLTFTLTIAAPGGVVPVVGADSSIAPASGDASSAADADANDDELATDPSNDDAATEDAADALAVKSAFGYPMEFDLCPGFVLSVRL